MRTLYLFLLLTLALPAQDLKVISWNIEWFPGIRPNASKRDQHRHVKGVREVLTTIKPDLLFAQEITDERQFKKALSDNRNLKLHVFSKFLESDGRTPAPQQCAIASTLPAEGAWFETFTPHPDFPSLRRGFAFAALKHPKGLLMTYCVHLKSNRGGDTEEGAQRNADTRNESVRQILAHKAKVTEQFAGQDILGWIVAGDLNTNHDNQFPQCNVLADLTAAGFYNTWSETPKDQRATWLSDPDPEKRRFQPTTFDYILTQGLPKSQATIPPNVPRELSDHAPVSLKIPR
ncbi:MAG: endonuclease/exonuclease/phosphatase family protein [Verrucomicrobiota bacterium]